MLLTPPDIWATGAQFHPGEPVRGGGHRLPRDL